jgi:ABC-type transporter Mla subunit MlaD
MTRLLADLASAHAENMKLRAKLDATERQLSALENANGDAGQMNEALRTELAASTEQVTLLSGLVALYEQLDEVNLAEAVDEGIETFGNTIREFVDDLPLVEEGLAAGKEALDVFAGQIPLLESGHTWLSAHLDQLERFYASAAQILETMLETAGAFLDQLNDWFAGIRRWLPFGVGDRAATVMTALATLLDETPRTIEGTRRNISTPLALWLEGNEEIPLQRNLVKPLKNDALAPASTVVHRVRSTRDVYEQEVVLPVKDSVARHALLRTQIAAYREEHKV